MQKKKRYTENEVICFKCIEDQALRDIIKSEGSKRICVLCGKKNIGVTIKIFSEIIDPFFRAHFRHGEIVRQYDLGDSDGFDEVQQGEDLSYVLQELLEQDLDCEDAIIDSLEDSDPYDPHDGEEPFYSRVINYESIPIDTGELYKEWNEISDELKSRRRFFSNTAKDYFDWLFEGLEDLRLYAKDAKIDFSDITEKNNLNRIGVVQECPAGIALYRGRRADTRRDYERILFNPHVELSPPPSIHARAGRMNPEGVSVFYGALDESTCLAEMRSSIGGHIVVGGFKTTKGLKILDFNRLDKAYSEGKTLSFFQDDFDSLASRLKFRRQLHRLISLPIITGNEGDYLITQVLAEYLAHVRKPNFDGILFGSTQCKGGSNIVLFSKSPSEGDLLSEFAVEYVEKSAELYRTREIIYDIPKLDISFHDNQIYIHRDYDDDE